MSIRAAESPSVRRFAAVTAHAVAVGWRSSPGSCLTALAAQIVASAAPTAAAWSSKQLVDGLGSHAATGRLVGLAAAVILLGGMSSVLGYAASLAATSQQRAITLHVESELFDAVNRLRGLRNFESPQFADRLRLAQQAASTAPGAVYGFGLAGVRTAITLAGFLGALLVIWWPMAVILAVAAVPMLLGQIALTRGQVSTAEETVALHRRRFAFQALLTNQSAVKEARIFGLGGLFRERMSAGLRDSSRREVRMEARVALAQAGFVLLGVAVAAVGVITVVVRAARGLATPGDVVLFVSATAGVQAAFTGTIAQLGIMTKAVRLFEHYWAVVTAEDDLSDGDRTPAPLSSAIVFRDVWFRYDEDSEWVLRGFDLTIPAGSACALVGVNGAGKSTLVKLLCRFYDPTRGSITWDGVDLRDLHIAELRRRIVATFQDYMTYDLSAAENIGVGDPGQLDNRERITAAARLAEIDETISHLPDGYDTMISRLFTDGQSSSGGVTLSIGQSQRLALARSLIREAELLILDEPSSGLDAVAEHRIHETLRRHRRGRTSVLISHRLSTVRDADVIAVVQDGRVAELGSHEDLMTSAGAYASMFALQASGYQDERVPPPMPALGGHMRVARRPGMSVTVRTGEMRSGEMTGLGELDAS